MVSVFEELEVSEGDRPPPSLKYNTKLKRDVNGVEEGVTGAEGPLGSGGELLEHEREDLVHLVHS